MKALILRFTLIYELLFTGITLQMQIFSNQFLKLYYLFKYLFLPKSNFHHSFFSSLTGMINYKQVFGLLSEPFSLSLLIGKNNGLKFHLL